MERMDGRTRRTGAGGRGRTEGGAAGRTSDAFSRADGRAEAEGEREEGTGDDGQRRRGAGLTCMGQKTGADNRRWEATMEIDYRMKLGGSCMNPVQSTKEGAFHVTRRTPR